MSEWKETTLGDFLTFQRGFDITKKQMVDDGIYDVIFSSGIGGKHNEYKVEAHGVVIGRKGTLGTVFYSENKFWATDTTLWVKNFHGNHPKFAYYFLHTLNLGQYDCGSANPTLNRNHIHTLDVKVPSSVKEQKSIADILSCLDAKIENLRRQNETLEQIAQTLFKHWFIDFEFPNADGKPYKSSGGAMSPSELGDIPEGWRVGKLKDISDITSSKRIFSAEYVETGIPFYRSKEIIELHAGQNVTTELYISKEKFNEIKSKFEVPKVGEILLTSVGTIGIPYLIRKNDEFYFKDGNLTWIKNFKNGFAGVIIYYWIKSDSTQNKIKQNTIGSTQKALTIQALGNISIFIPDTNILSKYRQFIEILNSKVENNLCQIQTLTKTRDALLPKLMSGQLRVKE